MKTLLNKLLKGRLTRWGFLAVLLFAVGATVGWKDQSHRRYQLGGAWVGELIGVQWVSTHAPLDADGKTATANLQWLAMPEQFKELSIALGFDRSSDVVGFFEMINKDTAKYILTWYGVATGTPPASDQVKAIHVMTGFWHYTGPDTAESSETYTVYLTDGNPSPQPTLFPADGATVVYNATFPWHPQYRVTVP